MCISPHNQTSVMDAFEALGGMCGSPRMGVMAGMGGMSGLFRRPGPPDGWYVRIIQMPRSPRLPGCAAPDTGDAHNTRDREPGGRVGQQRRPDIGTAPDTEDVQITGMEEMAQLHWILHGPDTQLAGLEGMPALAPTTH